MANEAEFVEFVAARYRALVRYGVLLTGDVGRGEDLVQEALVKTFRSWTRSSVHPEAYTRQVMARAAWRAGRRRWRQEVPTDPMPEQPTADSYREVDSADVVRRALKALPGAQRVVLTLRFLDGLSESETAAFLGCPIGTVKSRCSRALATLRTAGLLDDEPSGCEGKKTL